MKNKLLIALPLSLVLLSTAQAQEIETEQDLLNGMLNQMAGHLANDDVDLSKNSFMTPQNVLGRPLAEREGFDGNSMSKPILGNSEEYRKPLSRPILEHKGK